MQAWLSTMLAQGASDLHIAVGQPLVLRVNGSLCSAGMDLVTQEEIEAGLRHILPNPLYEQFLQDHDLDTAFQTENGRFRLNCFQDLNGPGLVLRAIALTPPTLGSISAPSIIAKLTSLRNGLVIITGPTGSGKSSTLAAMIDHINTAHSHHVITLEDPVEFVHKTKRSLITQREIGVHTSSFQSGLRAALREDPDVILVGELRDAETITLALTAAETGHLVFGTLHTNSAHRAVLRLIDAIPQGQREVARAMLANSLQAVIAQTLLPAAEGGRAAAFEILIGTHAVRNLIAEDQIPQIYSMMQMGAKHHMQTMEMALAQLVQSRRILPEIAAATLSSLQGSSIADGESDPAIQQPERRQALAKNGGSVSEGMTF